MKHSKVTKMTLCHLDSWFTLRARSLDHMMSFCSVSTVSLRPDFSCTDKWEGMWKAKFVFKCLHVVCVCLAGGHKQKSAHNVPLVAVVFVCLAAVLALVAACFVWRKRVRASKLPQTNADVRDGI